MIEFAWILIAVTTVCVISAILVLLHFFVQTFEYRDRHVFITGGSSGIGLELAKEYLKLGAKVTIAARNKEKLNQAADTLRSLGNVAVFAVSVDTSTNEETVIKAMSQSVELFGDVDVLVNCAGVSIAGEFDLLDPNEFERMLRTNVLGSVFPTRAALPGMKKKQSGRIIFVSSQAGQVAIHGYSAYGASKWALRGLAEALQMEVKPFGIFVSVAYPPDTDTPGYKTEMETKPSVTKKLSEAGQVFPADVVAKDIIKYSTRGYFGISTGLDGWLLKQLHPGMTPVNSIAEVMQQIIFSPIARIISVFYLLSWDSLVAAELRNSESHEKKE